MNPPINEQSPAPASGPWWRRRPAFVTLVLVPALLGLGFLGYRLAIPDAPDELPPVKRDPVAESQPPSQAEAKPEDPDAKYRRLVVGVWEDDYKGKRKMVLSADGTGTMLVEPGGLNALFASRLRFDMVWSVEDGRLNKRTVGGEPEAKVNLILKTMGDRVSEPILELNDQRLLLLDEDGQTRYDWRRVE
jgi:hypothetical protein